MKNVISKTGQSWKIIGSLAVIFLSGVSMIYGQLNIDVLSNELFFYYVAGGAIVGLLSFIFACVSIKCPFCNSKWFWSAVCRKDKNQWLFWLHTLGACPKCEAQKSE
jgi:predicted ferric reductase